MNSITDDDITKLEWKRGFKHGSHKHKMACNDKKLICLQNNLEFINKCGKKVRFI